MMTSPFEAPILNTYKRNSILFVKGEGALLFDDAGRSYIDCLAGIAVVSAGHGNSSIAQAIATQASTLTHVSNLYWSEPMIALSKKLVETTGGSFRVFFCNSGAEANECAIKLARKFGAGKKHKILCAEGGFHGRTLATLAATGQPAKWRGFEPLPSGFVHARFNDIEAFRSAVDDTTAAILVEPIQGERGVVPAKKEFLSGLREIADFHHIPLIFDEVQTGVGRCGEWWAFQRYGVFPDIFTSAKGIANGLPLGVCLAREPFASIFEPGDHGTTFGGGPVVCAAAIATIKYLESSGVKARVEENGSFLAEKLAKVPHVTEVRGMGLMRAAVLDAPKAAQVAQCALTHGLVVNGVSENALRFTPPLVISTGEIEEAIVRLTRAIKEVFKE